MRCYCKVFVIRWSDRLKRNGQRMRKKGAGVAWGSKVIRPAQRLSCTTVGGRQCIMREANWFPVSTTLTKSRFGIIVADVQCFAAVWCSYLHNFHHVYFIGYRKPDYRPLRHIPHTPVDEPENLHSSRDIEIQMDSVFVIDVRGECKTNHIGQIICAAAAALTCAEELQGIPLLAGY